MQHARLSTGERDSKVDPFDSFITALLVVTIVYLWSDGGPRFPGMRVYGRRNHQTKVPLTGAQPCS